jgi:hypothetical protein
MGGSRSAANQYMRLCCFIVFGALAYGQSSEQQPNYQPNWPCTGKSRAFDPSYAKISEATGGHLFLFDKSEITGMSTLAIGDMNHKQTIARASGRADSYVDIPFYVDSSVQSLFVVASLQCMQTIYLYDPQRAGISDAVQGVTDAWYHAGRMATIPTPAPGQWVLRLLGTGSYFVAIEAKSEEGLGNVTVRGGAATMWLDSGIASPRFRLVRASGETLQDVAVAADPDQSSKYSARVDGVSEPFRIQAEWTNNSGQVVVRTDPRLQDPAMLPVAK